LVVDGVERGHLEQAAAHARLVGRHHHVIARLGEARDRLEAARDGFPLLRALDVRIAVVIDHAVAVEDDELHAASLEMSATRFISARRSASSARRLRRSAGSSAITMMESKNESTGPLRTAKVLR